MTNTEVDPVPREHAPFFLFNGLAFGASAAATIYFCRSMSGGMDMPGGWTMSMMWMRMPGQTWAASTAMFLLAWLAMMIAMMLPSTLPMLLNYRRSLITPNLARAGLLLLLTTGGYFFVWLAVGAVVYATGVILALAEMRSADFSRVVPLLSGATLALAGCIQFTSWKMTALRQCRCTDASLVALAHRKSFAAWRHGLSQGVSCTVCCSGLMLTLLALGTMNLTVMTIVAGLIAMEKLLPKPEVIVRISGIAAVGAGLVMMAQPLFRGLTSQP
jgi:predicted metal-binding membrane protein